MAEVGKTTQWSRNESIPISVGLSRLRQTWVGLRSGNSGPLNRLVEGVRNTKADYDSFKTSNS